MLLFPLERFGLVTRNALVIYPLNPLDAISICVAPGQAPAVCNYGVLTFGTSLLVVEGSLAFFPSSFLGSLGECPCRSQTPT